MYITVACLKMQEKNKGKKYIRISLFIYFYIFLSVYMKLPLFLLSGKLKKNFFKENSVP